MLREHPRAVGLVAIVVALLSAAAWYESIFLATFVCLQPNEPSWCPNVSYLFVGSTLSTVLSLGAAAWAAIVWFRRRRST